MEAKSEFCQIRDKILYKADILRKMLTEEEQQHLDEVKNNLRNSRFEIAVIGVMKAGKSTFLNALINKPFLLPADVNPWSAVVTRMHFGMPDALENRAEFTFYTHDKWRKLQDLRQGLWSKLKSRLKSRIDIMVEKCGLTDSKSGEDENDKDFREKLEEKINRAKKKLGNEIDHLLGTQHHLNNPRSFKDLEPYLAAGDDEGGVAGKYSDITWEANLWFPMEPFSEYCIVVDTPGINDPDIIRSAQTEEYISQAHAFVFLMSAPQACTKVDIEEIKHLIMGLYKERMVVFINRLDHITDPEKNAQRVVERVEKILKNNFPKTDILVIIGSARWGELAEKNDEQSIRKLLFNDDLENYCKEKGIFTGEDIDKWRRDLQKYKDDIRSAALKASGILDARQAVESTLLRIKGKTILEETLKYLISCAEIASRERDLSVSNLHEQSETLLQGTLKITEKKEQLQSDINETKEKKATLDGIRKKWLKDFVWKFEICCNELESSLRKRVSQYADSRRDRALEGGISVDKEKNDRYWVVSQNECAQVLEEEFLSFYRKNIKDSIESKQKELIEHFKRELQYIQEGLANKLDFVQLPQIDPVPSLDVIRKVTINLGNWFKRLFSGRGTKVEKAELLKQSIIAAFEDAIERLKGSVMNKTGIVVRAIADKIDKAVDAAVSELEKNLKEQQEKFTELEKEKDPEKMKEESRKLMVKAEDAQRQAEKLRAFAREIRIMKLSGI